MKILISVDIEGVAGVCHPEQTRAGNPEYERARRLMTAEANAAIRGAFVGGASEVLVNDSHGGFRNLLPDELDPRARAVQGKPRVLGMMAGLEQGCQGVFMIGYHARAHSRGILAHTINSFAFARIWLGGQELGEAGLYGALAAEFGVPVLLASGDDVFAAETRPLLPQAHFVVTKTAQGHTSGISLSPHNACGAIEAQAREVMRLACGTAPAAVPPPMALPVQCRLQAQSSALADLFAILPGVERSDAVTVSFTAASVQDAVRTLNSLSAMSAALR